MLVDLVCVVGFGSGGIEGYWFECWVGLWGSFVGVLVGRKIWWEEGMICCCNCGECLVSEGYICMVCKCWFDIDLYKVLIVMVLLVYCGVSLVVYFKLYMLVLLFIVGSSV